MAAGGENAVRPSEAVSRLVEAWRGEVEARAVYTILAERARDPRRAQLIREIADGEARHRERIEGRLRELGQPIPDPSTVRISIWLRLQARFAPVARMLAHMESNEQVEITDRYKRSTGDADTDVVLAAIRTEEQSHSRSLDALRAAHGSGEPPPSGAEGKLSRILGRETWHRTGSGWISGAIYGANDGLAAVFGIVAGVSGATGGSSFVLTAGLSGAVASALSMATGAFLASRSEAEVVAANVAQERREIEEHPEEEKEELSLFYQLKGLDAAFADQLAQKLAENPDAMLKVLATEELGGSEAGGDPVQSALAAGISTFVGAMVPVTPFFFLRGTTAVLVAATVSLVAHFLVGAAKSLFTLRKWWSAGLEMTAAGVIVGSATYVLGLLLKGSLG
ncbi:MAG TPA: VIT1/CCC1 transporter family protein [Candidatus Micrarchaeaceae archaeon]|nr:VIT1/CCC1 transporter family protein [Candidatus Micrarchaeaceae archaeon]